MDGAFFQFDATFRFFEVGFQRFLPEGFGEGGGRHPGEAGIFAGWRLRSCVGCNQAELQLVAVAGLNNQVASFEAQDERGAFRGLVFVAFPEHEGVGQIVASGEGIAKEGGIGDARSFVGAAVERVCVLLCHARYLPSFFGLRQCSVFKSERLSLFGDRLRFGFGRCSCLFSSPVFVLADVDGFVFLAVIGATISRARATFVCARVRLAEGFE